MKKIKVVKNPIDDNWLIDEFKKNKTMENFSIILNYLNYNGIEANIFCDSVIGDIITFSFNCFEFKFKIEKSITLQEFINKANDVYLKHLENSAKMYESMAASYYKSVENYKPILN